MRTLDTTVLVRQPTLLTPTVLIEAGWVLRGRFGFDRAAIAAFSKTLFDFMAITVENGERVRWAVRRFAARGDLADPIHVATCGDADAFATFDRGVAPAVSSDGPVLIETLS